MYVHTYVYISIHTAFNRDQMHRRCQVFSVDISIAALNQYLPSDLQQRFFFGLFLLYYIFIFVSLNCLRYLAIGQGNQSRPIHRQTLTSSLNKINSIRRFSIYDLLYFDGCVHLLPTILYHALESNENLLKTLNNVYPNLLGWILAQCAYTYICTWTYCVHTYIKRLFNKWKASRDTKWCTGL